MSFLHWGHQNCTHSTPGSLSLTPSPDSALPHLPALLQSPSPVIPTPVDVLSSPLYPYGCAPQPFHTKPFTQSPNTPPISLSTLSSDKPHVAQEDQVTPRMEEQGRARPPSARGSSPGRRWFCCTLLACSSLHSPLQSSWSPPASRYSYLHRLKAPHYLPEGKIIKTNVSVSEKEGNVCLGR